MAPGVDGGFLGQVQVVERGPEPQHEARSPRQDGLLETQREVGARRVHRQLIALETVENNEVSSCGASS